MRKTFLALAALSLAGAVTAQVLPVAVAPKVVRNHAEQSEVGLITWIVTTAGGVVIPPCASGATTFRGAGIVGHFTGRHNTVVTAVWDKDEILAAQAAQITAGGTGALSIRLADSINLNNFTHTIKAVVADPGLVRVLLEGHGPLPPATVSLGNDGLNLIAQAVDGKEVGLTGLIPTTIREDPATGAQVTNAVGTYFIPLGGSGGGGVLEACLGPTGQVRFINDGNNGDWASDCVANGWRAETISLGAGSPFADALNAPNVGALNTFTANCALAFGAPTAGPVTVNNPIGISLAQVQTENIEHRIHQFFLAGTGNSFQVFSTNPAPGLPKLAIVVN